MTVLRAYSTFDIKAMDEESKDGKRKFAGVASTPSVDRMGDIVEPKGAEFKFPIPFLWQHNSGDPIGWILGAKVTDKGIDVEGEVAQVAEPAALKDRLDLAWGYIKSQLVRGLSIGFQPLESSRIEGTYSYRYTKWSWLELSAVTIPANADASLTSIKSFDRQVLRSVSGGKGLSVVRLDPQSGVPGESQPARRKGVIYLR